MTETASRGFRGAPTVAPPKPRDAALDGMRALAALAVLATHTGDSAGAAGWRHDVFGVSFRSGLALQQLNVGVEIFFVISAFLLYRGFVAAHLSEGRTAPAVGRFYLRRFWRIYPAYWVALFVIVGLSATKALDGLDTFLANTFLVQGWRAEWIGSNVGLRQSWSLVIEVAFYAILPLWAWCVRFAGRYLGPLRAELAGVGVWFVAGPVSLWWLQHHDLGFFPWPLPFLGVFAWGMLFAIIDVAGWQLPRALASTALCWLAAAALFLVFVQRTSIDPLAVFTLDADAQQIERLVHGAVAGLAVLPLALGAGGTLRKLVAWAPLALVGVWSYGFYLWHYFVLDTLRDHVFEDGSFLFSRLFVPTAVIAAGLGAASWYLIEKPLMRRSRRPS